jgi:hypothetical protein
LFKPQEYAGSLKLADATADISSMREEWERTAIPGGKVWNLVSLMPLSSNENMGEQIE